MGFGCLRAGRTESNCSPEGSPEKGQGLGAAQQAKPCRPGHASSLGGELSSRTQGGCTTRRRRPTGTPALYMRHSPRWPLRTLRRRLLPVHETIPQNGRTYTQMESSLLCMLLLKCFSSFFLLKKHGKYIFKKTWIYYQNVRFCL